MMEGKLTEAIIESIEPGSRSAKYGHAKGLYLLVNTNGSKYWRMKYRFMKKEGNLAFGVWPEVSLEEAIFRCLQARHQLRQGVNPGYVKRHLKVATNSHTLHSTLELPTFFDDETN